MEKGWVSLVGAGCGDPQLLTLKAQDRLRRCEVLVYDSLVDERVVGQAPASCEKIYVGKRYGSHVMSQEQINALLVQKAREKKRVVRLKGGDPYVFGRGGEEALALMEAGVSFEEIPGITSAVAAPAAAGIPVTHRGMSRSFTVVTATVAQEGLQMDFASLARLEGTLVILMGMHCLEEIARRLILAGKSADTPCAVVTQATLEGQKSVRAPLSQIAGQAVRAGLTAPGVIVVGEVAALCLGSAKAEKTVGTQEGGHVFPAPLSGVFVGVAGTESFSKKLSFLLENAGACVWDMGFMQIREKLGRLPDFARYGWLVFTSPNGVRIFLDKLKRERRDLRALGQNKIAVTGPGTAAVLEEAGMYADYMPDIYDVRHLAQGLAERIALQGKEGEEKPALFLRAAQASPWLAQAFCHKGLPFEEAPLYEVLVDEKKRREALRQQPDYVVFGAGSSVRAYFGDREAPLQGRDCTYVCIGEACAKELSRYTKAIPLTAKVSSAEGIVDCLIEAVRSYSVGSSNSFW